MAISSNTKSVKTDARQVDSSTAIRHDTMNKMARPSDNTEKRKTSLIAIL